MASAPRNIAKLMREFLKASGGSERVVRLAFDHAIANASKERRSPTKRDILNEINNIKALKNSKQPA